MMHQFNVCLCLLIAASRAPSFAAVLEYGAPPAANTIITQYHTQDEHGQYAYGYTAPLYYKHEARTADGVTHGSYSYVDARGEQQTVDYKADVDGYRVVASTLQQQANKETPEVAALRAQHLAAHEEARLRLAGGSIISPVQDTPEVAAAKVAFFKRFEAEKLRNQQLSSNTKSTILPSRTILSQPIYVFKPANGFILKYSNLLQAPTRDYLPVA